jgi:N,N'-diacetyllegionaminate synthase
MNKILIIAEAGVNHNGSLEIAFKLVDTAVAAGADVIKFQTFTAINLMSKSAPKAIYQKKTTDVNESQFEMIQKLELDYNHHIQLQRYCNEQGIEFLSTPFDIESIDLLHQLGLQCMKIPSGEITNYPYLRALAKYNKQIIMSTGMANLGDIESALEVLTSNGTDKENIVLLHCNTEYPTPFEDVNLNAIQTMGQAWGLPVGYSDHTKGIEVPIAAVAMGATIIEKHFTLDRTLPGPDHKASLEPHELKAMVSSIRNIEKAMGNGIKTPSPSEMKNMPVARKSIVAAKAITKGELFTEENLTTKRPGDGISPMNWKYVLGRRAISDFGQDEKIEF